MNEPFDSVPQDATVYPRTVRAEVTRLTAWGGAGTGSDPEQAQRIGESIRRTVEELGMESKNTKSAIVTTRGEP